MNTVASPTPETTARIERDQAERAAALWQKPLLADAEIAFALSLPYSSWQMLKSTGDIPKLFKLGRRVYARTSDLRAWLDEQVKA